MKCFWEALLLCVGCGVLVLFFLVLAIKHRSCVIKFHTLAFFSPACQHYGLSFCVRYGGFTFLGVCSLHQSGSSALERAAALWQQCMRELGCSMTSRLVWKCLDALSFERGKLRPADVSVQYGNPSVKGEVWNWVNENEMWSWECGVNEVFLSFHFYGCILFLGK